MRSKAKFEQDSPKVVQEWTVIGLQPDRSKRMIGPGGRQSPDWTGIFEQSSNTACRCRQTSDALLWLNADR